MSRLLADKNDHNKYYFCEFCLSKFKTEDALKNHTILCEKTDYTRIVMPEPGTIIKFKNFKKFQKAPIVVYADFESILIKMNENKGKSTILTQKHKPISFCYNIVCLNEKYNKTVMYSGEDCIKKFITQLLDDTNNIINELKNNEKKLKKL